MKLNEAETLYMFGLVRSDLDDLRRREITCGGCWMPQAIGKK